jgi:hypothetical protein
MSTVAIAVVGSRNFQPMDMVRRELDQILSKARKNGTRLHIVSGGARGVDTCAEEWAHKNQVMYTIIPAEWDRLGRSAGYARNHEIWDMADIGIAFWDGQSKGTQHSFDLAEQQGKKLKIVQSL